MKIQQLQAACRKEQPLLRTSRDLISVLPSDFRRRLSYGILFSRRNPGEIHGLATAHDGGRGRASTLN